MSSPLHHSIRAALAAVEDPTQHPERQRMLALLREPTCTGRSCFVPGHFTASGFVLAPDGAALLLIFHRKLNKWLQPGGHLEVGDANIIAAAHRELTEEVAFAGELVLLQDGPFDLDIHPIPARKDEPAHEHFDVRFLFRATQAGIAPRDEVAQAEWVPLDQVAARSDVSVSRVVPRLRHVHSR